MKKGREEEWENGRSARSLPVSVLVVFLSPFTVMSFILALFLYFCQLTTRLWASSCFFMYFVKQNVNLCDFQKEMSMCVLRRRSGEGRIKQDEPLCVSPEEALYANLPSVPSAIPVVFAACVRATPHSQPT